MAQNLISRGCTVTNTFKMDIKGSTVARMFVTYQQNGVTVLEKTVDDADIGEDGTVVIHLSQEDTLCFNQDDGAIRVQIRILTDGGTAIKSKVMTAMTDELLKDGVI